MYLFRNLVSLDLLNNSLSSLQIRPTKLKLKWTTSRPTDIFSKQVDEVQNGGMSTFNLFFDDFLSSSELIHHHSGHPALPGRGPPSQKSLCPEKLTNWGKKSFPVINEVEVSRDNPYPKSSPRSSLERYSGIGDGEVAHRPKNIWMIVT